MINIYLALFMKNIYLALFMSLIVSCVLFFLVDYLVHQLLLMEEYIQTIHIWRPVEEMTMWPFIVSYIALIGIFQYCYLNFFDKSGRTLKKSLALGFCFGIALATTEIIKYGVSPITAKILFLSMLDHGLEGLSMGGVCFFFLKKF